MKQREFDLFVGAVNRISPGQVKKDEPMSRHTTIAVGGPAKILVTPRNLREVIGLVKLARNRGMDFVVIGRGSNLLVRDGGFSGLVIKIAGNLSKIKVNKRTVFAEAGASFSLLAQKAVQLGRSGLEFAVGIPGTVGGAVWMNAGAYGSDVSHVLNRVKLVDEGGQISVLKARDIDFGYRKSRLPPRATVLSATFRCPPGVVNEEILKKSTRRVRTQPLEFKSFGSTFVNPPGNFAGRLIEECGLKGIRKGGAMVSKKHANFILNIGENTKASDIETLINLLKREVRNKFGVTLEPEVVIIGD